LSELAAAFVDEGVDPASDLDPPPPTEGGGEFFEASLQPIAIKQTAESVMARTLHFMIGNSDLDSQNRSTTEVADWSDENPGRLSKIYQ
jgi:hypothetical protein